MVFEGHDAFGFRAVGAAEHALVAFKAVADDARLAMGATGRQRVDGALEAVERVFLPIDCDLKSVLIYVAAVLALRR